MLRVSESKDLVILLQRLLSPSTIDSRSWDHRCLLRSMQRETRIKLGTNNFKILEQVNVVMIVQGISVDRLLGILQNIKNLKAQSVR